MSDIRVRMSRMRKLIARRMHESLQGSAQLTIVSTAEVGAFALLRKEWTGEPRPSYTDAVIRACALALKDHPGINARLDDDAIVQVGEVNIGMAVAVEGGLVVPVVRGADALGLAELAGVTRDLAERARTGGLAMADLEGGTFTVTSLGGQGVDAFTPVLNAPESAILGVGRTRPRAVPADDGDGGGVRWAQEMTLSLTIDHRVVDGYPGALFLARVVELLGEPGGL